MIEALHDFMPAACTWNVPHGGFFVWVEPAARHRRQGDAAARGHRAGRLRARHRLLRRRLRRRLDAAVVLLPHPRADPRGRTPPRRRARGGDGAARDLRRRPAPDRRARPAQRLRRPEQRPELEGDPMRDRHLAREQRGLVLAGGLSHERDVSLRSGRRVAEALRGDRARGRRARRRRRRCCRLHRGPAGLRGPDAARRDRRGRRDPRGARAARRALRRRRPGRVPDRLRQAGRQDGGRAASASPRPRRSACRTRRSASSARPR